VRKGPFGVCAGLCLVAGLSSAQAPPAFPRIRSIVVENKPVFGPDERLEIPHLPDLTFIFELANLLHIDTKDEVIRRELLLGEGDPADPFLIEESERNLRALPYIRQVKIVTIPAPDGRVDLVVLTQDTWTTQPRASFAFGAGTQRTSFGLVETNVLGYGKKVRLLYRSGLDRSSSLFEYDDPRVLGSRWAASGDYQDTSDGRVAEGTLQYPFFSLETPWSGGGGYSSRRERDRVFDHFGDEIARFRRKLESSNLRVGHRLEISDAAVVWRSGLFYRRSEETFSSPSPGTSPELVPLDRRESQPGVFLHRETVNFVREHHLNLFDRIEDVNLGNVFDLEVGYSTRALDALVDEPILTAADRQGFDFGPGRKVFVYGLLTGRHHDGDLRNAVVDFEAVSYYRWNLLVEHTLVSRLKLDLARNLDRDTQIVLGNFNGLRGFGARQFVGEKRFIFNLEDRLFFVNDLFHLVSLGAVVFFDSGYVWDRNQAVDFRRMATSAGIGLRIDAPRGSGEALFRLDLAVPLTDGGSGKRGLGVTVGSGQAFDTFEGPFDLQSTSGP
jgi:Omp85 superfamily domain/Surface antigen variable number repeat